MTTEESNASKSGRWQFSLRTLLGAVAFIAVGCLGLTNAIIGACVITATWIILLVSVAGSLVCRGYNQAFWIGFASLGWGYIVVRSVPISFKSVLIETYALNAISNLVAPVKPHYWSVGYLLWTLILAFLGGLLARYFYSTRADEK